MALNYDRSRLFMLNLNEQHRGAMILDCDSGQVVAKVNDFDVPAAKAISFGLKSIFILGLDNVIYKYNGATAV
jgi:hypothetical protein